MVHELVRYMKSVNMHGEKIKGCVEIYRQGNGSKLGAQLSRNKSRLIT